MKLKDDIIISSINNSYVLIDTSSGSKRFGGLIKLNETSKDIIEAIKSSTNIEEAIDKLLETYDVERDVLIQDVDRVVNELKAANLIED